MVKEDVTREHRSVRPAVARRYRRRRNFWQRHFAFTAAVVVTALALIVAFVSTLVYARVDAGRTITTEPSTIPRPPSTRATADNPESGVARAPEILNESDLAKKTAASIRTVRTQDESGQPVEGTAFVAGSFGGQTLFLTSFAVVRALTKAPAPPITLEGSRQVTLWTWHEEKDLALLVVPGGIETLPWAPAVRPGDKVWAAGAGQKLAVGVVTAAGADGVEHNIFVEGGRQGAPIVNQKGEVVAMASAAYNPGGKGTDTVFMGVPIRSACERVLRCGDSNTQPTTPTSITPATTRP